MVKPALAEPQFPGVSLPPVAAYLRRRHRNTMTSNASYGNLVRVALSDKNALYGGHLLVKQGKGTNEAPKHTQRHASVNAGSPTGRESYGDGTPVVVGARESLAHGEGAASEKRPEPFPDQERQGR